MSFLHEVNNKREQLMHCLTCRSHHCNCSLQGGAISEQLMHCWSHYCNCSLQGGAISGCSSDSQMVILDSNSNSKVEKIKTLYLSHLTGICSIDIPIKVWEVWRVDQGICDRIMLVAASSTCAPSQQLSLFLCFFVFLEPSDNVTKDNSRRIQSFHVRI